MTKVNGELVSIDDSAYDGFKGMTIYGKTVQNLWAQRSHALNGITVESSSSGSITVSGTSETKADFNGGDSLGTIYTLKPSTSYVVSVDRQLSDSYSASSGATFYINLRGKNGEYLNDFTFGTSGRLRIFFTTRPDMAYANCCLIARDNVTLSGTYRVMLREATPEEIAKAASTPQTLPVYPDGSGPDASDEELGIMPLDEVSTLADSDFDDYWCPPGVSSIDNVEVVTAGKNLFTVKPGAGATSAGITYDYLGDGAFHVHGTASKRSYCAVDYSGNIGFLNYVSFRGKTLTASRDSDVVGCYFSYFVGQVGGRYESMINFVSGESASAVVPDDATWARSVLTVASGVTVDEIVHFQLELGSTATDYEPPHVTTDTIDLQSNSLRSLPDGTRDELHIDREGNCTLVKRVGEYFIDGSTYKATSAVSIVEDMFSTNIGRNDGLTDDFQDFALCDRLPPLSRDDQGKISNGYPSGISHNADVVTIKRSGLGTDVDVANTWLQSNETTLLMPLATPQTIQLGKISLPKLRKKPLVNNIWANGTSSGTNFSLAPEIDYEYNPWSTYCDGFRTHGKHSYFDMGCCIAARDTGTPEKKSVTATVPYMSGFYDLSKLYGAIAFESRQLMYRFEFVEDSRDELQRKKSQFLEWLSQVHDEEIADDDIPGRHFIGSLSEWEFEEGEEGQSGSLEVTFNCQPFLEADEDTTKTCNAGSNTVTVAGQAVNAYAKTNSGTATIRIGGVAQSVGTTEIRLSVQLQPGDNAVTVTGSPVVLRWRELTV